MRKGNVAHGVECAQLERFPGIGASGEPITNGGIEQSVTVEIFVGTNKRAVVPTSGDRCGTSEREQRQDRKDQGGREDHGERLDGDGI